MFREAFIEMRCLPMVREFHVAGSTGVVQKLPATSLRIVLWIMFENQGATE